MVTMTCPAAGCKNGYIFTSIGGTTNAIVCGICGGTGRVEMKKPVRPNAKKACPYDACGGKCKGKGYYDYQGNTIYCNVGRHLRRAPKKWLSAKILKTK